MIRFIKGSKEFEYHLKNFKRLFSENELRRNPFNDSFKCYLFFVSDCIWDEDTFNRIINFLKQRGDQKLYFYIFDQHAKELPSQTEEKNYVWEGNVVEILILDINDSYTDYYEGCVGRAQEICYTFYFFATSDSLDWGLAVDELDEIGVVGFKEKNVKDLYLSSKTAVDDEIYYRSLEEMKSEYIESGYCPFKLFDDLQMAYSNERCQ